MDDRASDAISSGSEPQPADNAAPAADSVSPPSASPPKRKAVSRISLPPPLPPTCLDPWYAQSGEHVSADLWGVLKPVREAKHVKPWAPLTDGSLVCGLALRLNRAAAALLRKGGLDILLDIKAGKRPSLLKDAKPAAVVMLERADGALVLLRGIHVPKLSPGFRVGLRKGTTTWWHSGNHDIIFKSSNSKQRHWLDPQYWPDGEAAADKDVESKSDRILLKAFYEGRQPAWVLPLEQGQRDLDDGWLECPCPLQLRDPSDAPHQQQEEGSSHDDGMDLGTEHDEQEKEKGEADASVSGRQEMLENIVNQYI